MITLLHWYGQTNAMLALGAILFVSLARWFSQRLSAAHWLALGKAIFLIALGLPLLAKAIPQPQLLRPSVQVWSGTFKPSADPYKLLTPVARTKDLAKGIQIKDRTFSWVVLGIAMLALFRFGYLLIQLARLRWSFRNTISFRRIGRVQLLVGDDFAVPFSCRFFRTAYVVLPSHLLGDPRSLAVAVRHELQHHRQRDTSFLYWNELFKSFFLLNPAVHFLARELNRFQELACDEFLVIRRKVPAKTYARCLLSAAEHAGGRRTVLVGTTSMAATTSGLNLKRRIEMLFQYQQKERSRGVLLAIALGTLVTLGSGALFAASFVQERRLSFTEASWLAERASQGTEIPVTVNELVLARLNEYVGTPKGQKWFREAKTRMPMYESMIQRKLDEYGLPKELIAVPFWESGFRNDAISPGAKAKGIWQFVAGTAKRYGLYVEDPNDIHATAETDERLNPEKETDAGMRYLRDLNKQFQDWRLALKAYNEGEYRVQHLIEKYGTRDPWELERLDSSENYLSGVIAMIILLKNPSTVD